MRRESLPRDPFQVEVEVEVEVETIYLVKNPNLQYTVGIDIHKRRKQYYNSK